MGARLQVKQATTQYFNAVDPTHQEAVGSKL